jgi:hypothetical protein
MILAKSKEHIKLVTVRDPGQRVPRGATIGSFRKSAYIVYRMARLPSFLTSTESLHGLGITSLLIKCTALIFVHSYIKNTNLWTVFLPSRPDYYGTSGIYRTELPVILGASTQHIQNNE